MRSLKLVLIFCVLASFSTLGAEDANQLEYHGVEALKLSQTKPDAILSAAAFFAKATDAYVKSGDEDKATEMNSFLYWCKKKMTSAQMDVFLKDHDKSAPELVKRLKEIESTPLPAGEVQKYYNRAESFAGAHPTEHLLIAIRFFEVADRFRGTDAGMKALDRSLKAQQLAMADSGRSVPTLEPGAVSVPSATSAKPIATPETEKRTVPQAKDLKTVEATVKELFKQQYQKSAAEDRVALAHELLKSGLETTDDPVSKFVLLSESRNIGAAASDVITSMHAIDALDKEFKIDAIQFKMDSLAKAASASTKPDARLAVAQSYVDIIESLMNDDKFDAVSKLLSPAETAVQRCDPKFATPLAQQLKDVRELQTESAKVKKALEALAKNASDPNANSIIGKFYCVSKNQWERGLPLLNVGDDANYKEAAATELSVTGTPESLISCADLWWSIAGKEKSKGPQLRLQYHAKSIYERANLAGPKGLLAMKLKMRMKELPAGSLNAALSATGKLMDRAASDKLLVFKGKHIDVEKWKTFLGGVADSNGGKSPALHSEGTVTYAEELWGKKLVLAFHPAEFAVPTIIDFSAITQQAQGSITLYLRNFPGCDCQCEIFRDGKVEKVLKVEGDDWKMEKVPFQHQSIKITNKTLGIFNQEYLFMTYDVDLQ